MKRPTLLSLWRWLGLVVLAIPALAADDIPAVEKSVLFSAGDRGYVAYRIPAIIVTPQKNVLVAAEGRKESRGDWGHIDIFYRLSRDSGRTWEAARTLVSQADLPAGLAANPAMNREHAPSKALTISNATWITDAKTGRTLFLFCVEYMRCFVIESSDGGETFSKPREITSTFDAFRTRDNYAWRVIATGPGHGAQLSSGRLVVPVWISTADGVNAHHPSLCATIYSDDGGLTWQAGAIVAGRDAEIPNPSETAIAVVSHDKVMLAIRHESDRNRKALTWSTDGASGWSKPQLNDALWEPVCMASLASFPDGGLVFSNPASLEKNTGRASAANRKRQNLGVRFSGDDGKSWSAPLVLEPGPSAYSDLAVAPDGSVLCFYEHGKKGAYETLTVARISEAALRELKP